jgi:hypothetical protein
MYLDLKSAQGSFINKSKCDSDKYYRLYVGDILRLGASTRQYIVGGPEEQRPPEYDSANMARYREHLAAQSTKAKQRAEQQEARSFASWGMDEDAVDPNPNLTDQENNDDESEESGCGGGGGKKPKLPEYLRKDENYHRKYADKFSVDLSGIDDAGVSEVCMAIYIGIGCCYLCLYSSAIYLPISMSNSLVHSIHTHFYTNRYDTLP